MVDEKITDLLTPEMFRGLLAAKNRKAVALAVTAVIFALIEDDADMTVAELRIALAQAERAQLAARRRSEMSERAAAALSDTLRKP